MSAHTKGPWRVRKGSMGVVGRPNVGAFDVVAHAAQRSNIEANARLIAAAPELLEALREAVHFVAASYRDGGRAGLCNAGDLLEQINNLFAKIDGQAVQP